MRTITINAAKAATAWINAALACSQNPDRGALYRTISVEVFREGVQFIACDGTLLFRSWGPAQDGKTKLPQIEECPEWQVVVQDIDKFALAFMKTLLSALDPDLYEPLVLSIEPMPTMQPSLGEEFAPEMLTLSALGQQLHCKLHESEYPDWRHIKLGVDPTELVDEMKMGLRMFSTLGKIKDVYAINLEFHGHNHRIDFVAEGADTEVRGYLMPMFRADLEKKEKTAAGADSAQEAF